MRLPPPPAAPAPCSSLLRDSVTVFGLLLEAFQLSSLSLRALPRICWFDRFVLPAFFGPVGLGSPPASFFWASVAVVCGTVLLIIARMMYEIREFHALKHQRHQAHGGADAFFFHSFVGSLLYGHGQPERLPGALCGAVSLVCDTLFFAIVDNMCSVMVCFSSEQLLLEGTSIACWSTRHRAMCAAALVAFGYFVPVSILVAPVLAEANKGGKRISFAKPYLMCVCLSKVAAAMVIVLCSSRVLPSVLVALCLCLFVASLTLVWALRTSMKQPSPLPKVNAIRFSFTAGAVCCALVALILIAFPELNTAYKYMAIGISLLCFDVVLPGLCFLRGVPGWLL